MSQETVILRSDRVFKWDGPKRKQTLIKAKLGRLLLTDRRLVFLSTGKNDITAIKLVSAGLFGGSPDAALKVSHTGALDITALTNEGAIDVPGAQLRGAELHGAFKVMTVTWVDSAGAEQVATFADKNAGMPDGPTWVAHIQRLAAAPPPIAEVQPSPTVQASWLADPRGRHELRYWDGNHWTEHVSDQGVQGTDPV
jgi:hypothetical protein